LRAAEVPPRLRSRKPLWRDIQRDGVLLLGTPLEQVAKGIASPQVADVGARPRPHPTSSDRARPEDS